MDNRDVLLDVDTLEEVDALKFLKPTISISAAIYQEDEEG